MATTTLAVEVGMHRRLRGYPTGGASLDDELYEMLGEAPRPRSSSHT